MSEVLEITFEGRCYRVTYSVSDGLVTARTVFDSKTTQVGGSSAETVARLLAMEMIKKAKREGLLDR